MLALQTGILSNSSTGFPPSILVHGSSELRFDSGEYTVCISGVARLFEQLG